MGKLLERFRKFKTRERVLLIVSIIVLFYIGIDRIVVTPFLKSINETKERLETQKKLLKKYYSFVINKKQYETRLNDLEQYYLELQDKFLSEKTEDIASAKLQDIIDELADNNGLDVTRSTVLKKEVINERNISKEQGIFNCCINIAFLGALRGCLWRYYQAKKTWSGHRGKDYRADTGFHRRSYF